MISVLLVDDHEMVRLGVSAYLSIQEDISVIGQASNGKEGVEKALALKPDVILMDLVMEEMDGIEATQCILSQWPEAKIIIVTSFLDDEKVFPALKSGARGYLLKTSMAQDISDAIYKVYAGEQVLGKQIIEKIQQQAPHEKELHEDLTLRENEVLLLIAQGYSNQEIAEKLFITLKTVKTHVSNVLSKLEVEDRTQATIYAFKKGLVK
ncbi:response regulator transcription factor [Carnobacteriaceae bacterium zg-84]|uniref:response regulator n=1 Tax=Granulicatella sp. zg-84 TaxID=2678503 RepID=UPI0013C05171|nr:response regulator transcription factor [Granulicatella sp. zg-84]NEW66410.1 response regulator [Granulicatella sp. zg-84]QMI86122.1 response regulator transcription factor [Carnobacteriaceae bacterium zg-84]